ncbi:hypothetical protein BGC07_05285 [Piscirickettsia litoralis]|uniref:Uncharacterized protein n=2 Tax=Piscirickettsia litoralis TaxID=1891921 RepID=A0ABX3A0Q8_9GAMM|nr:hypothetical protein BGC07_05285 [Piscirickettsia litoralis]
MLRVAAFFTVTVANAQTIQISTESANSSNKVVSNGPTIQQKLNEIISQQLVMINNQNQSDLHGPTNGVASQVYFNNPYNNSIGFGVLSSSAQNLVNMIPNQSAVYQSIISNENNQNGSINENIRFLLNLVEGKYDADKKSSDFIDAGAVGKSNLLVNAVLSKINANNKINNELLLVIKAQMNNGWMNNLKYSSRDQLLRDLSVQLSVSNYINYQKLQAQYLNAMLSTAKLIDNSSFYQISEKNNESIENSEKMLNDIDQGISKLVGMQKIKVMGKGN